MFDDLCWLMTELKFNISIYFVTSVFSFILNSISTKLKHKNETRLLIDSEQNEHGLIQCEQMNMILIQSEQMDMILIQGNKWTWLLIQSEQINMTFNSKWTNEHDFNSGLTKFNNMILIQG